MFHLPIPIEGTSGEPVGVVKRTSNGAVYNVIKYSLNLVEGSLPEIAPELEHYSVVTNESQTKVFAYMAPKKTVHERDMSVKLFSCNPILTEPTNDSIGTIPERGWSEASVQQSVEIGRFSGETTQEFRRENRPDDPIEIKEALEGTLITFFWNDEIEKWDICTRNGVGGNYSYIRPTYIGDKPKTFRDMVMDVFNIKFAGEALVPTEKMTDLNDVPYLKDLSKNYCYSCILQHPENHIVYSISRPALVLVSIYETSSMPPLIDCDSPIRYNDCVRELQNPHTQMHEYLMDDINEEYSHIWKNGFRAFSYSPSIVESCKTFDEFLRSKREVFDEYENSGDLPISPHELEQSAVTTVSGVTYDAVSYYYPPAWILTNTRTGQRCELANPFYESAKNLRNMQPNLRYLYHTIRKEDALGDYLTAFPQYFLIFDRLEQEYNQFVTEVHSAYVKFYIMKQRDQRIAKKYFVHAARIHHNVYMAPGQEPAQRCKITRQIVHEYFDQLSVSKLFYLLTHGDEDEEIVIEREEGEQVVAEESF